MPLRKSLRSQLRMVEIGSLTTGSAPLDECRVTYYMETLGRAEPVVVYEDKERNEMTLASGYHRLEAAIRLNRTEIKANVSLGTRNQAANYPDFGPREPHCGRSWY